MSSAFAKEIGEEFEFATARGDERLELVGDGEAEWYDARLEDGTPVEIKACSFRVSDASTTRRGRFWIRKSNHDRLLEEDGKYRLVVYDDDRQILVEITVPANVLEDAIGAWIESGTTTYTQVRWPAVIDVEEVTGS